MIINSYRIIGDSHKALAPCEDSFKLWQQGEGSYWVDIRAYETDELEAWLGKFHLSDLSIQCCREAGETARFISLHDAVFFEFPVYKGDVTWETEHLSFLCMENLLVTLHSAPLGGLDTVIKELTAELPLMPPTTTALVCLLSLSNSARSLRISEALRKSVLELDERMDNDPESVAADEILDQKRSLRTLDTVVSSQLHCFEFMSGLNRPFLDLTGLTAQFQFSPINAHAANQNVDRLAKTLVDIRQRFEMNQQEKTNRRLAVLTILSAIFMPITLIAGIYGMNFEKMPELHFGFGYPAVLIFMGLIAGGMYLFFRTRGWLD